MHRRLSIQVAARPRHRRPHHRRPCRRWWGYTQAMPNSPAHTPLFVACDFDGTITERDTLDLVVRRYAPGVWESVEGATARRRDHSASRRCEEEFEHVRAHGGRGHRPRPGRRPEYGPVSASSCVWIEDEGHRLLVVSAGFRTLIDPVLAAAGLSHLHVHAGDALFSSRRHLCRLPALPHAVRGGVRSLQERDHRRPRPVRGSGGLHRRRLLRPLRVADGRRRLRAAGTCRSIWTRKESRTTRSRTSTRSAGASTR